MSIKNSNQKRKITEIDGDLVVNYFFRKLLIDAMFMGYAHCRLAENQGVSMKHIASEFILSYFANDDDISEDHLVRNYYRFIPIYQQIVKTK